MKQSLTFFKVIVPFLILGACKTKQEVTMSTSRAVVVTEEQGPQLLFLNFLIYGTEESELNGAKLVNQIRTAGKLKRAERGLKQQAEAGDLLLIFADIDKKPIKTMIYSNPLLREIEYPSDSGTMGRKIEKLKETQFSIRAQVPAGSAYIMISRSEAQRNREDTVLLTSKIEAT